MHDVGMMYASCVWAIYEMCMMQGAWSMMHDASVPWTHWTLFQPAASSSHLVDVLYLSPVLCVMCDV